MNSGFTGIRLVPYLRAQYESQKEPNGLILQLPKPDPMTSCPPGHAWHMRAHGRARANGPALEGSVRECVARPEGKDEMR
jgi:hypothetical protein